MGISANRGTIYYLILCVLVVLTLHAQVFGVAEAYSLADLEGIWEVNSLASGPGAPWWIRGPLTINSDGSFSGTLTESDVGSDSVSGTLTITTDGIITSGDVDPDFRGCMDSDKTMIVGTGTWDEWEIGTTEISVWLKKAKAYSLSDLEGVWEVNSLASGPGAPWWERGPLTIGADGSFSGTFEQYEDDPDTVSGTLSISSDGVITLRNDGGTNFRGAMDSGKSVVTVTQVWTTPGTTEISVWVKKAEAYSLADLEGIWEVNSLASGPGAPWWIRGPLTINSDGSFSGTQTESDGGSNSVSGTLQISADGVMTLRNDGGTNFRGAMDSGKSVVTVTQVWTTGDPGTTEISVWVKKPIKPSKAMPWIPLLLLDD